MIHDQTSDWKIKYFNPKYSAWPIDIIRLIYIIVELCLSQLIYTLPIIICVKFYTVCTIHTIWSVLFDATFVKWNIFNCNAKKQQQKKLNLIVATELQSKMQLIGYIRKKARFEQKQQFWQCVSRLMWKMWNWCSRYIVIRVKKCHVWAFNVSFMCWLFEFNYN